MATVVIQFKTYESTCSRLVQAMYKSTKNRNRVIYIINVWSETVFFWPTALKILDNIRMKLIKYVFKSLQPIFVFIAYMHEYNCSNQIHCFLVWIPI